LGAETPHVATLAKVLWAGVVEMGVDLVVQGLWGWGAHGCRSIGVVSSAGVPFRRCDYGFGRVAPASVPPFLSLRIDHGMGDCCWRWLQGRWVCSHYMGVHCLGAG